MRANFDARPCAGLRKSASARTMGNNEKTMQYNVPFGFVLPKSLRSASGPPSYPCVEIIVLRLALFCQIARRVLGARPMLGAVVPCIELATFFHLGSFWQLNDARVRRGRMVSRTLKQHPGPAPRVRSLCHTPLSSSLIGP